MSQSPKRLASEGGLRLITPVPTRLSMPASKPPATFVSDLRPSRVATVEGTVSELEAVRDIATRDGTTKKVRNGKLRNATGEISLVLWGSEVDLAQLGDRVRIVEGWVSDFRGRPRISLGRTGRLEKIASQPSDSAPD